MITASNALTLLRGPLALLFLFEQPSLRVAAVLGAILSDSIDGWLARRFRATSRVGAMLDPIMDKFFVLFVVLVFISEHKLAVWQLFAMASRDIALLLFGGVLLAQKRLGTYTFKPVVGGKISTALQFLILTALTLGYQVPALVYTSFYGIGALVLTQHLLDSRRRKEISC